MKIRAPKPCEQCGIPFKTKHAKAKFCSVRCVHLKLQSVPLLDRVVGKIEKTESCWLWRGSINPMGYGQICFNGKHYKAHRVVYELLRARIPAGLTIDHLCRNHACVNPDHLEPVTQAENVRRGNSMSTRNAKKVLCHKGHPLEEGNLYRYRGQRICRTCTLEHRHRSYARRRAKDRAQEAA